MKQRNIIVGLFLIAALQIIWIIPEIKAQNSQTSSVQMLVQQQIEEAKKKNNEAVIAVKEPEPVKVKQQKIAESSFSIYGISLEFIIKASIMLIASAVVFSWLQTRKAKKQIHEKNSRFKRNIKMMREEKFIKDIDPKLKEIRTKLTLTSVVLNEDKKITAAARKSQIGKEEILLASRIRSHEIQYSGQRSFA